MHTNGKRENNKVRQCFYVFFFSQFKLSQRNLFFPSVLCSDTTESLPHMVEKSVCQAEVHSCQV